MPTWMYLQLGIHTIEFNAIVCYCSASFISSIVKTKYSEAQLFLIPSKENGPSFQLFGNSTVQSAN